MVLSAVTAADVFDLALSLVVGVLYGIVAWTIGSRRVSKGAKTANQGFATWWWGLAVLTAFGAVWEVIHWFVPYTLAAQMAYIQFVLLVIIVALDALLYYFLYLWSGKSGLWVPITVFYLALYILFVWYIQVQAPSGVDADGAIQYANDLSDSTFATFLGVSWLVPTILGAIAYLTLISKAPDRLLRFRIGLVAGSIIIWFLVSIGSGLAGVDEAIWWTYVSRVIAAAVAALTLIAYRPPAWARRMFRLEGAAQWPTQQ